MQEINEKDIRISAAISEMQSVNSMLLQRNMDLAGEVATLRARLKKHETPEEKPKEG